MPMIYELRVYHAMPGKLPVLLRRFEDHTLKIWERLGIRLVGFWTTLIGESNQQLTYMLAWQNMAEREKLWSTFAVDAEWIKVAAESEREGPIVQNIANQLLQPTGFSPMK
jgi:NIPSNAP protein